MNEKKKRNGANIKMMVKMDEVDWDKCCKPFELDCDRTHLTHFYDANVSRQIKKTIHTSYINQFFRCG